MSLPAAISGRAAAREALYEDAPAFAANAAFERRGAEEVGDVVARVVSDPSAAWGEGGPSVGASR